MKLVNTLFYSLINLLLTPFVIIVFLAIILWRPFTFFQAIEIAATKLNKWFEKVCYIHLYVQLDKDGLLTEEQLNIKIHLEMKKMSWWDFIWVFVKHFLLSLPKGLAKNIY